MIRFYDIVNALGGIETTAVLLSNAAGSSSLYSIAGAQSGYTFLFSLPKEVVIVMAILLTFIVYKLFQKAKYLPSYEKDVSVLFFILLLTMPAITGFMTGPLFWFFSGGILFPFIISSKLNH